MKSRVPLTLIVGSFVLVSTFTLPVTANFMSLHFGLMPPGTIVFPCPLAPETNRWAASDYVTMIVVQWGPTRRDDRRDLEVTAPNGRVFVNRSVFDADANRRCSPVSVPILGTTAETWLGTWRVSVAYNGKRVGEGVFELGPAREGALAEAQRLLVASPSSAAANFRAGATAALAGQNEAAERYLKEASRLSPTWWNPPLALARLYLRAGNKDAARERLLFLRGLLMGRRDDPGTMVAFYQAMMEDLLKEVGE
jgi:hypothetical protein